MEPALLHYPAKATLALIAALLPGIAQPLVQRQTTPGTAQTTPQTLTLRDALDLAQKNDPAFLSALNDAALAREDLAQARAAVLPTFAARSDYLGTQGNGKLASGRFVTNDGVHVYRDWLTMHQDLSPGTFMRTGIKRADAVIAIAKAKAEVARRGLSGTVTKAYYALIVAQRKYANAQEALNQAQRSLQISEDLERGREVAHSDVVKSQLTYTGQQQAFEESKLAMESARLDLA
ncbi:MAG TPA: TolC family protein, partial [Bryobacteraceae bacterium]|nr:TolC family protein [Bryobacteraceae bacterium]